MTKVNEKKRKLILVSVTFVLCITIMLSGTFAWHSLSQTALNETMGEMTNPGGRLHDDFNGSNKDIYVENFTDNESGMPIIVRVRLFEYMETGENAGNKSVRDGVTVLTEGALIDDPATWALYDPDSTDSNQHYGYWNWKMGGKTVYMPTFNKDKDDSTSDRNGTYEGKPDTEVPFDDYVSYKLGDVVGAHEAKETIDGTVVSMAYWLTEGGKQLGNYWVYDGDGWAYWANPLWPQEATGLLLSEIGHSRAITDKWYYGIYVECQMVTADEVGSETNKIGFYGENAKKEPSVSARDLLDKIIEAAGYTGEPSGTYGMLRTDADEALLMQMTEEMKEAEQLEEKTDEIEEIVTEPDKAEEDKENVTESETTESEPTDSELSKDDNTVEEDHNENDTSINEEPVEETDKDMTTEIPDENEDGDTTDIVPDKTENGDMTVVPPEGTETGNKGEEIDEESTMEETTTENDIEPLGTETENAI